MNTNSRAKALTKGISACLALAVALAAPARALNIQFDYTHDTFGFFTANPTARTVLESAAAVFNSRLDDTLAAITPTGSNRWTARPFSPADPSTRLALADLVVPADTVIVFVGGGSLPGSTLGLGGQGSYTSTQPSSAGSAWPDLLKSRGEAGALAPGGKHTDFGPWGGTISFNRNASWYFDSDPSTVESFGERSDFYTVALHELGHVLGLGTAESWGDLIVNGRFVGAASIASHGGPVALDRDPGHWAAGTLSTVVGTSTPQEALNDPTITIGTRKFLTNLDLAALTDVGWEIASVQVINFAAPADRPATAAPFIPFATASSGLPVNVTVVSGPAVLSGPFVTLTGAGTVVLRATQPGNASIPAAAPVEVSFAVFKQNTRVILGGLWAAFDGAPKPVVATTTPAGLVVTVTYDGGPDAPSAIGSYAVEATIVDTRYSGQTRDTLVIARTAQAITFAGPGTKTLGDAPFALSATASSGLAPTFMVVSGPAAVAGTTLTVTGVGTVTLRANQAGDATYAPAPPVDRIFPVLRFGNILPNDTLSQAVFVRQTAGEHRLVAAGVTRWTAAGLPGWLELEAATGRLRGVPPAATGPAAFRIQGFGAGGERVVESDFTLLVIAPGATDFAFTDQEFREAIVGRTLGGFTFVSTSAFEVGDEPAGSVYRSGQWNYARLGPNQAQITLEYTLARPTEYEGLDLYHRGALTVDGLRYDVSDAGVPSGFQRTVVDYRSNFTPRDVGADAVNAASADVSVRWRDESWADGYNVYRTPTDAPPGPGDAPLNSGGPLATGGYTDRSGQQGVTYRYWVTAVRLGEETPPVASARAVAAVAVLAPVITQDPAPSTLTIDAGRPVFFRVGATGLNLSYQWFLNGQAIPGATGESYGVLALVGRAGSYTVQVRNDRGVVTSRAAILTVRDVPVVLSQPESLLAAVNTTQTIDLTVAGTGLTFQWVFKGKPLKGATREDLAVKVTTKTAGAYTVRIRDANGATTEATVTLRAMVKPVITRPLPPAKLDLALGAGARLTLSASGESLAYQWFKNGQALPGETASSLTLANARADMAGRYTVTVSNLAGGATSKATVVTVNSPPAISSVAGAATLAPGAAFSLSVAATGPGKLTYQWQLEGVSIAKATKAVYAVKKAATKDAGSYTVVVRNAFGATTSAPAAITLTAP